MPSLWFPPLRVFLLLLLLLLFKRVPVLVRWSDEWKYPPLANVGVPAGTPIAAVRQAAEDRQPVLTNVVDYSP